MKPTYLFLALPAALFLSGLSAQSPGGVSANLSLWIKADAAAPSTGGTLTGWTTSAGSNTFTKTPNTSTAGITTVANQVNFHPVVRFTGAGTLRGNTSITWSECTAVASWNGSPTTERGTVISPTTSGTAPNDASRYYFRSGVEGGSGFLYAGMGSDSIGFEYVSAPPDDQVNVFTASGIDDVLNENGMDARIGSLYGGFTKRGTSMTGIPQIGDRSTADSKMIGDIAEVIVYSSNNATGRNKVESYLALKYGLTLGNGSNAINYTSSSGQIFWTGNTSYQHNIFGIGTDQGSGLVQSSSNSIRSGSGNGTGQNQRGNLLLSTASALSNQQFLMIGTDSGSLSEMTITAANGPTAAVGSKRLIRTWKVQNTGSVGSVTLSFDTRGLTLSGGTTASNYYLMIDNNGDGNFTTGTQSYVGATSFSTTKVNFTVSLSNNVVFTIITLPNTMIPLPATWESFIVEAHQDKADLRWIVSGDDNVDHYEVERSGDGTSFIQTGRLTATGNDSYEFTEQLLAGTYYYRVRMIDKDGHYQFSPVRVIRITGQGLPQVSILSNPVQGSELILRATFSQPAIIRLRVIDRQGRLLAQKVLTVSAGGNSLTIDFPSITGGLYYLQWQTTEQSGAPPAGGALPFLK